MVNNPQTAFARSMLYTCIKQTKQNSKKPKTKTCFVKLSFFFLTFLFLQRYFKRNFQFQYHVDDLKNKTFQSVSHILVRLFGAISLLKINSQSDSLQQNSTTQHRLCLSRYDISTNTTNSIQKAVYEIMPNTSSMITS